MEPEEILVGVDGDSVVSTETVGKYSFISELLSHWLILSMIETRDVGRTARIGQGYTVSYDGYERQFPALSQCGFLEGPWERRRLILTCHRSGYESCSCS